MQPSLLALALVAASCAVAPASAQARLEPAPILRPTAGRPAPTPYPTPPGIERPEDERPPRPARLGRDEAVVGRLRDEGWSASLGFEARAGELSLFEFTAWGYARGWTSRSALVVRDADGRELARSDRGGGTVFQDVLPFVAPAAGAYSLEVVAVESGFRYLVVRHAAYASRSAETVLDAGDAALAQTWIEGDASAAVTLRVAGEPGALVLVRAEPTTERGRNQKRALRRRLAAVVAGLVDLRRMTEALGPRARDDGSFPDLVVDVRGADVVGGRRHAAVVRVPASGTFDVAVRRAGEGPPALFDLTVERTLEFGAVPVRVGDEDDDPVAGARVALLLEPALDPIAMLETGPDGTVRALAPPGDYTIVLQAPGGGPTTVRARLEPGEPLNLVALPGQER